MSSAPPPGEVHPDFGHADPMSHDPMAGDLMSETPVLPALDALDEPAMSNGIETRGFDPDGLEAVYDVPVKVQAVLGRSRMDIGSLMRLKTGDILELDRRVGEPVDILVNNRLIARGEIVLIDGTLGVTLTEIVRQAR